MCTQCGLVYQPNPPSPEELRRINCAQEETTVRLQPERLKHKIRHGNERWAWLAEKLGQEELSQLDSFLEIGSGEGTFLEAARGHVNRAVGMEFNPVLVDYCRNRGLEILENEWPLPMTQAQFQMVAMFHVLEHMSDPIACLQGALETLPPNGYLYAETPDIWHPFGNLQKVFMGPDHILLLSHATMRALLAKAGFEVIVLERVELGMRVLARPHPNVSVQFHPQDSARLRRVLWRHQLRWLLVAEWREWMHQKRKSMPPA